MPNINMRIGDDGCCLFTITDFNVVPVDTPEGEKLGAQVKLDGAESLAVAATLIEHGKIVLERVREYIGGEDDE